MATRAATAAATTGDGGGGGAMPGAGLANAGILPGLTPGSQEAQSAAEFTHLCLSFGDCVDSLPPTITRSISDLRELDAVLSGSLETITLKLNRLLELIEDKGASPLARFELLRDIAREARAFKLGGEDKIRVATGTCETLIHHTNQLDLLANLLTSLLPQSMGGTIPPPTWPHGYPLLFQASASTSGAAYRRPDYLPASHVYGRQQSGVYSSHVAGLNTSASLGYSANSGIYPPSLAHPQASSSAMPYGHPTASGLHPTPSYDAPGLSERHAVNYAAAADAVRSYTREGLPLADPNDARAFIRQENRVGPLKSSAWADRGSHAGKQRSRHGAAGNEASSGSRKRKSVAGTTSHSMAGMSVDAESTPMYNGRSYHTNGGLSNASHLGVNAHTDSSSGDRTPLAGEQEAPSGFNGQAIPMSAQGNSVFVGAAGVAYPQQGVRPDGDFNTQNGIPIGYLGQPPPLGALDAQMAHAQASSAGSQQLRPGDPGFIPYAVKPQGVPAGAGDVSHLYGASSPHLSSNVASHYIGATITANAGDVHSQAQHGHHHHHHHHSAPGPSSTAIGTHPSESVMVAPQPKKRRSNAKKERTGGAYDDGQSVAGSVHGSLDNDRDGVDIADTVAPLGLRRDRHASTRGSAGMPSPSGSTASHRAANGANGGANGNGAKRSRARRQRSGESPDVGGGSGAGTPTSATFAQVPQRRGSGMQDAYVPKASRSRGALASPQTHHSNVPQQESEHYGQGNTASGYGPGDVEQDQYMENADGQIDEGDDQGDLEGDGEGGDDVRTYCYCDRVSFGNMIGCDDKDCAREWFHWACVGLTNEPKGEWFCDDCQARRKAEGPATNKRRRT